MSETPDGAAEAVTEDTPLVEDVVEQPGDNAAATPEEEGEQPKPKKTAKDRIDELTWKLRETERREAALLDRLQRPAPAQEARQPQADAANEDPEPDPADYEHGELDVNFIRDVTRREARLEFRRELAERDARQSFVSKRATFDQRVSEQFPDGEPEGLTRLKTLPSLSEAIGDVILTSENGPRLADHLGKNPGELQRLSALAPHLQAYELAKMEARLTQPTPVKTATDAPPATPQIRGAGGRFQPPPDTDDSSAFEKPYGYPPPARREARSPSAGLVRPEGTSQWLTPFSRRRCIPTPSSSS